MASPAPRADDERQSANPASLSMDPNKRVARNKPVVKPPLKDVPMGRFLTYLTLGLLALAAFYSWRLTVWADNVGGYWNLMTGRRPQTQDPVAAGLAAGMAANVGSGGGRGSDSSQARGHAAAAASAVKSAAAGGDDTDAQLAEVADKLGYTPEQLKEALKMLKILDPKGEGAAVHADAAAAAAAAAAAEASAEPKEDGPSILSVVGEALLD